MWPGSSQANAASRPASFEQLAATLDGYAWKLAWDFYIPGCDRDDVHQIALIAMWEAWATHDPAGGPLEQFAVMVMRRTVIDELVCARRGKRWADVAPVPFESVSETAVVAAADPFEVLARREQLGAVVETVHGRLTALERATVAGRLNRPGYELGHRMTKSTDNALQRARRKVAAALMDLEAAA